MSIYHIKASGWVMLCHRRQRWPNIAPPLRLRLIFGRRCLFNLFLRGDPLDLFCCFGPWGNISTDKNRNRDPMLFSVLTSRQFVHIIGYSLHTRVQPGLTIFAVTDAWNDIINTRNRWCATQLARRDISRLQHTATLFSLSDESTTTF